MQQTHLEHRVSKLHILNHWLAIGASEHRLDHWEWCGVVELSLPPPEERGEGGGREGGEGGGREGLLLDEGRGYIVYSQPSEVEERRNEGSGVVHPSYLLDPTHKCTHPEHTN